MWGSLWTTSVLLTHAVRILRMLGTFPDQRARLRLVFAWIALEAKLWWGWFPTRHHRLRWRGPSGELEAVVFDLSEIWAISETFVGREYELIVDRAPRTILDLGSNVGISVLYFAAHFPDARIVAVEAVPRTCALLRRNTDHLPNVTVINAAVAGESGVTTIYSGAKSLASSTSPSPDRPVTHDVPALTVADLSREAGIEAFDFIKMDVEGAETPVVERSADLLQRAEAMVFEFHQEHTEETLWDLLERLPRFRVLRVRGDTARRPVVELERVRTASNRAGPTRARGQAKIASTARRDA